MSRHPNSFDFLRLMFALLVIITHSVVLTGGGETDFLHRLTGGQLSCSYLGVRGFFVISGFLIFRSMQRSAGVGEYLKKRALRIFPALMVMLLLVTFVAGPVLSSLPAGEYFSNGETLRYIGSALRIPGIQKTAALPGVFTRNPVPGVVNGSLWTIWFELLFYVALLAFFPLRKHILVLQCMLPAAWLLLFGFFLFGHAFLDSHLFPMTAMSAEVAVDLALYFAAGSTLALLDWSRARMRGIVFFSGCLIIAVGLGLHHFRELRYLGIPLTIIAAGHYFVPAFGYLRRAGEPSYGIYIYAYPVQQAIIQLLAPSPLVTTLLTFPVVISLGLASWRWVEEPILRLKQK